MLRAVVGLGLLALAGCGPRGQAPPGPSVLVVTLDTTRADRLGAWGYPHAETPTWDWVAKQGTRFARAYSASPLTIPSHATLFTGLAPPTHGVRDDGDFALGSDAITLAERFRDAGWTTAAFTASFSTQRRWGLTQGFTHVHDAPSNLPSQLDWRDQRRADEVVDDALSTLPNLGEGPLFVWVHLYDAHWPYDPPEPWRTRHSGRPYDGEIAFADAQAARLLAWFETHRPNSIVVVAGDHGESLGDGGEQTHGILLHDGTLRVPLLVKGPGVEAGRVSADPVGLIDIAPTVLSLAGLQIHPGVQGRDLRDGGSHQVYSEALGGQLALGLAPLRALTDEEGRTTRAGYTTFHPAVGDDVLLTPDPPPERGGRDLAARAQDLAALEARLGDEMGATVALEAEALEMMSVLGYAGGDPEAEAGAVDPRDVADLLPLSWQARQLMGVGLYGPAQEVVDKLEVRVPDAFGVALLKAQLLRRRGALAEAHEAWTAMYARTPSATVALQLAAIHATLGEWPSAEGWYRAALRRHPGSAAATGGLGRSLVAQGRVAEAEALVDARLVARGDHPELALVRAELLLGLDQPAEAEVEARAALAALPWSPWAHVTAGQAHWALGRSDEAIAQLQEALRLAPYNRRVRRQLAVWMLEVGNAADAVRLLAPLVRLLPDDPEVARAYADALRADAAGSAAGQE